MNSTKTYESWLDVRDVALGLDVGRGGEERISFSLGVAANECRPGVYLDRCSAYRSSDWPNTLLDAIVTIRLPPRLRADDAVAHSRDPQPTTC